MTFSGTLSVDGLSCLGAFGQGPDALLAALSSPPASKPGLVPEADTAGLAAYFSPRALRGSDRFSRLALYAACLALEDAAVPFNGEGASLEGWGIILASGYGPVTPTLEFIDSIEAYGQAMASPLAFSHSVHNIPAAIIAKSLNLVGPCATICVIENPVASGLLLAWDWLREGRVDRVLFGAADETTPTLARTTQRIVTERIITEHHGPAYTSRKDYPVTDGACFFCLSRDGNAARGRIQSVDLAASGAVLERGAADIRFLSGAVSPQERAEAKAVNGCAAYGNIPVAQAFDCVAALAQLAHGGSAVSVHRDKGMSGVVTLAGKGV